MIGDVSFLQAVDLADAAVASVAVLVSILLGHLAKIAISRLAESTGVDDFLRGTTFDRVMESFGTSSIGVVAAAVAWLIYLSGVLVALEVLGLTLVDEGVVTTLTAYMPNVVAAAFILIFGVVVADKLSIKTQEYLSEVRVSDVKAAPAVVRYSVIFVAFVMALTQLQIATTALHILLAAYVLALVVFTAVGFRVGLSSVVAGLYVLTRQPYSIGDRVEVDGIEGIVQEIDLLATRVEDDERIYVVPNSRVLEDGVSREAD